MQTHFFFKREGTPGLVSCQAYRSSAWNRSIVGPLHPRRAKQATSLCLASIGPGRYVSGRFGVSGKRRPREAVGSEAEPDAIGDPWDRLEALAGDRGGARAGKSRWVSNRVPATSAARPAESRRVARAILTDIEGTTSSIAFVKEVLFPYARRRCPASSPRTEASRRCVAGWTPWPRRPAPPATTR